MGFLCYFYPIRMASNWEQLTNSLSDEHKEELARDLLEALESDRWKILEIIVDNHSIHYINVKSGRNMRKLQFQSGDIVNLSGL